MDFNEYQEKSRKTAIYPNVGNDFVYPLVGLTGESGEIANKIKKLMRDEGVTPASELTAEQKQEIAKEMGDILWYVSQLASELGLSLQAIAATNLEKINDRKERQVISGDGDNR